MGDDSITRLQFHGFDLNHPVEGRLLGYERLLGAHRPLGRVRDVLGRTAETLGLTIVTSYVRQAAISKFVARGAQEPKENH